MSRSLSAALSATSLLLAWAIAAPAEPRILVYGDSNSWGWSPVETGFPAERYPDAVRWPGVLEAGLAMAGVEATVVVDALSGRTVATAYPEPQNGIEGAAFAGLPDVAAAAAAELPLDLVIVMLGTNDARSDLGLRPEDVGRDVAALVSRVSELNGGVFTPYPAPAVLVVAPPAIGDTSRTPIAGVMEDGPAHSNAIADAIVVAGAAGGFPVFDARTVVTVRGVDGVHLTAEDHAALGHALTPVVASMLDQ
jgi:lysophospholipase L1-like esterase